MLRLQVPHPTLDKDLAALLESQHDADVKFKVENAEFAAHKLVLTFRSPFFRWVKHNGTTQNEGTECVALQPHMDIGGYSLTWLCCPRLPRLNIRGSQSQQRLGQTAKAHPVSQRWLYVYTRHVCLIWQVAAGSMTPKCTFCIVACMLLEMWRQLFAEQHHASMQALSCHAQPDQAGTVRKVC